MTRTDLAFGTLDICTSQKYSKVEDIIKANKLLKLAKEERLKLTFPKLTSLEDIKLIVYQDASFGNLSDEESQGGFIIFLCDKSGTWCLISWSLKRIKRVVKSTLAAETLSLVEATDNAYLIVNLLSETIYSGQSVPDTISRTGNKSLFETIHTNNAISDKRLGVEMAAATDKVEREEIKVEWIDSKSQLVYILTKKGVSRRNLIDVLEVCKLPV